MSPNLARRDRLMSGEAEQSSIVGVADNGLVGIADRVLQRTVQRFGLPGLQLGRVSPFAARQCFEHVGSR